MPDQNTDTQNQNTDTSDQSSQQQQGTANSWRDGFSNSEYKGNENFKKYGTLDDMGKAHLELTSMIGKKGVIFPNENDENDVNRYYKELGRPEKSEEYKNPEFQIEDEFKQFYSEEKIDNFKKIAHKYGLNQKQFEGLTKEYSEGQLAEIKNIVYSENKKRNEAQKILMNEWVMDYDANSKQSELAIKSFAKGISDEKITALSVDPDVKRMFFNVAQSISEDKIRRGEKQGIGTAQSLQAYIDSQVKVTDSSYYNQSAPDHIAAKEKVRSTYEQLAAIRKAGE